MEKIDEYVDVVTETGKLTGIKKLKLVAEKDGDWHIANHLWIINSKKELLLQKRAKNKKFYPNTWDISTAGNCRAGESVEETTIREAKEELGLYVSKKDLVFLFKCQSPYKNDKCHDNHINYVYIIEKDLNLDDLSIQKEEVISLKFMNYKKFEWYIKNKNKNYTPHFEYPKFFSYLHKKYN